MTTGGAGTIPPHPRTIAEEKWRPTTGTDPHCSRRDRALRIGACRKRCGAVGSDPGGRCGLVSSDPGGVGATGVDARLRAPTRLAGRPACRTEPEQPARAARRSLVVASAAVSVLAVAAAVTAVVLTGGDRETAGSAVPVAGASATAQGTAAGASVTGAGWCAEEVSDGRSVGRGPGTVDNGPGVIRAFDHAYYAQRDGGRVASLMLTPNRCRRSRSGSTTSRSVPSTA